MVFPTKSFVKNPTLAHLNLTCQVQQIRRAQSEIFPALYLALGALDEHQLSSTDRKSFISLDMIEVKVFHKHCSKRERSVFQINLAMKTLLLCSVPIQ